MEAFLNRVYGFDPSRIENRKYARYPLSLPAQCHYRTGEGARDCMLVDVSEQGVGFELDSAIEIRYGQNVLLSIFLPDRKLPVSAIARLQWIKIPCEGMMKQRVGSSLVFINPREKAMLLQHAHAMLLVGVAKNSFTLSALACRYPKFNKK